MVRPLLILVALALVGITSARAETWPIKEFKVIQGENPKSSLAIFVDLVNDENYTFANWLAEANALRLSDEHVQDIENWYRQLAYHFESEGFLPPRYEAIGTDSDGKKHFDLYVIPFGDPDSGASQVPVTVNDCLNQSTTTLIKIHPEYILRNGKIHAKAYQDMAHELFHTVQYAYNMFQGNCTNDELVGKWITEGTAEAVGIEAARTLRQIEPYHQCQMGPRRYYRQLYVYGKSGFTDPPCGQSRSYQTASFWQFLGEYSTRRGFVATPKFVPPDFSYLHGFFLAPHGGSSTVDEYTWVSQALRHVKHPGEDKTVFGIELHRAYARFTGTFASYWEDDRRSRYPGGTSGSEAEREKNWVKELYGTCSEVHFGGDVSGDQLAHLSLDAVAARCIAAHFDSDGLFKLTFFAKGSGGDIDPDALSISMDGGKRIIRRDATKTDPERIGFFEVPAEKSRPTFFIVSNTARAAGESEAMNVTLRIVSDLTTGTMAKATKKERPPKPTPKEELDTAWQSQSWTGKARQRDGRACTQPFEAGVCGPTTRIALMLQSDVVQLMGEASQPGMSFERLMTVFGALEQDKEQVPTKTREAIFAAQSKDAWEIDITVPQMQEGYTGGFDNARITVAKAIKLDGRDGGSWRAVGPGWTGDCPDGYHPLSGNVVIEEFTGQRLAGRFTAELIDPGDIDACKSAPVARPIDGTFVITDIDLGGELPEIADEDIIDDVVDSTNEVIPGLIPEGMREYIKEVARQNRAEQEAQASEPEPQSQGGSVFEQCGCQCDKQVTYCAPEPPSPCCEACRPIFDLCDGVALSETTDLSNTEEAEVAQMRARYAAYIDSVAPNDTMRAELIQAFDDLETLEQKRMFMMAIPQP